MHALIGGSAVLWAVVVTLANCFFLSCRHGKRRSRQQASTTNTTAWQMRCPRRQRKQCLQTREGARKCVGAAVTFCRGLL